MPWSRCRTADHTSTRSKMVPLSARFRARVGPCCPDHSWGASFRWRLPPSQEQSNTPDVFRRGLCSKHRGRHLRFGHRHLVLVYLFGSQRAAALLMIVSGLRGAPARTRELTRAQPFLGRF